MYTPLINKIKRRRRKPKQGDYVFAHRWGDADLRDPWHVGFVDEIIEAERYYGRTQTYYTVGNRRYKHAHLITSQEGSEILGYNFSLL